VAGGVAGLVQPVPPFQPTVTTAGLAQPGATPPATVPPSMMPPSMIPPGGTQPGGTGAGVVRRIGRWPLAAALAAVAAAGVGAAVGVVLSSGGTSSGPGNNASAGTTSPAATASRAAVPQPSTGSTAPSPTPNPAACVIGSWRVTDQQVVNNINGQQVVFTGSGATSTFRPDGTYTSNYNNVHLNANVNGVEWSEVVQGTVTGHWAIDNGDLSSSSVTSNGTETLYEDGTYNNSGPLETLPVAAPYQCSGNTFRESFPTGGSAVATRVAK
jgi:hypothetical protein